MSNSEPTAIKTISCKLAVSPHQRLHIEETLRAFADACNFVAEYGRKNKVSKQFKLHKTCYKTIRQEFGLAANLAVRAIARASVVLGDKKKHNSVFKPTSIDYDARIFSLREFDWTVSLTLFSSRERFKLDIGKYQKDALRGKKPTSAVLAKKNGGFYLDIQVKTTPPEIDKPSDALGVDLGIKSIATLSSGETFVGDSLNSYRLKRHKVRKSLQSKAHKSKPTTRKNCRRILKRLSGRQQRFSTWLNHIISKRIVKRAKKQSLAIVLEDLNGIRDRTNRKLRKSQHGLHNTWSFYQLRQFLTYKAQHTGIPLYVVPSHYTSQICHKCLHIGKRNGKTFSCPNCGLIANADVNAAKVIAAVGAAYYVNPPENSSALKCDLYPKTDRVKLAV